MGDLYIDFAVINSLSLIFHEGKKNMLFSPRCVSCAASEYVRIFLCLAAQEKSLGASVAEGGGRWDMINFCPIEKKTLNGANKLSLGHGSKIDSVLFCSRVPGTFFCSIECILLHCRKIIVMGHDKFFSCACNGAMLHCMRTKIALVPP